MTSLADIAGNVGRVGWAQIGLGLVVIACVLLLWSAINRTTIASSRRSSDRPFTDDPPLLAEVEGRTS